MEYRTFWRHLRGRPGRCSPGSCSNTVAVTLRERRGRNERLASTADIAADVSDLAEETVAELDGADPRADFAPAIAFVEPEDVARWTARPRLGACSRRSNCIFARGCSRGRRDDGEGG